MCGVQVTLFGASRKCACSSGSLQLQIRRGSNATSCCRVWLEKLPTAQRFSLALTCSQNECQVVMPPKNSLVPDPQPGLDSDGRHWEYAIKLTCGRIPCNTDSAYKRREHVQKKLSGKHRHVAPPLWQHHHRGDTFPRPGVNDLRGIPFWYSHEGFESQLPAVGARQQLGANSCQCLCLAVPMSRQPTRGAHKLLLRPHSSLLTLRSACAA